MSNITWSKQETEGTQLAFEKAYEREIKTLIEDVRDKGSQITELDAVWQLHDFLSAKRYELDGKYDNRESARIFVFAQLLQEGWLKREELQFLESEKLAKITALARM